MKFKTKNDRNRVIFTCTGKDRVKRTAKKECDINNIMLKYQKTGVVTHMVNGKPQYGDFSDVQDYQSCVQRVLDAESLFMSLSSSIRKRFKNDPSELIAFVMDDSNFDEAVKLGIVEKPVLVPKETPLAPSESVE